MFNRKIPEVEITNTLIFLHTNSFLTDPTIEKGTNSMTPIMKLNICPAMQLIVIA
ncbi:MAG: hypothetical protein ACTSO8_06440 [Promethearchaeota archaeon]